MPAVSTPETPPEPMPGDTRQRILRAALRLFGEVGYAQATTRQIAAAAGVNEVTLFRHFGSKKALLMACIDAHNAAGFAATFEAGLTGEYAADILWMAGRQIADMSANMELLRVMVCDARSVPELRQMLLAGGRSNMQRLSRYFQSQIEAGAIRDGLSAEALSIAFDSLFSSGVLLESLFGVPRLSIAGLVRPLADLFVQGTRRPETPLSSLQF